MHLQTFSDEKGDVCFRAEIPASNGRRRTCWSHVEVTSLAAPCASHILRLRGCPNTSKTTCSNAVLGPDLPSALRTLFRRRWWSWSWQNPICRTSLPHESGVASASVPWLSSWALKDCRFSWWPLGTQFFPSWWEISGDGILGSQQPPVQPVSPT